MSKVVIQECKDYSLNCLIVKINDAIELFGGWDKFVKPQDKVLLKVNLAVSIIYKFFIKK